MSDNTGITRSSTVDPYLNAHQKDATGKLQRNASNTDMMNKKPQKNMIHQQNVNESGSLQRSLSLNTRDMDGMNELTNNFNRVLSVNPADQGQIKPSQQNVAPMPMHQPDMGLSDQYYSSQMPSYGMYPNFTPLMGGINPYYNGMGSFDGSGGLFNSPRIDAYGRHQSEISNTPHAVTSTMNQVFTPMYHPMMPPAQTFSPQLNGMSPYPNFMHVAPGTSFSPYISNLATPNTSNMNSFALPPSSATGANEGNARTLNPGQQGFNGFMPQTSPMAPYNYLAPTQRTEGDIMLEELRAKLKNHPSTTAMGQGMGRQMNLNNSPGANVYEEVDIHWGLKDIKGFVSDFAKDQFGSRFIQSKLADENVPKSEKDDLFEELKPMISQLCKDVFGNYVVQKLLDIYVGTHEQHNVIYRTAIKGHMYELSTHMYGCRVIQKLIEQIMGHTSQKYIEIMSHEKISEEEALKRVKGDSKNDDVYDMATQDPLLLELNQDVLSLVTDQNGNHVIQKAIEQVRPISRLGFFFENFHSRYVTMSKHPYGCRVVQRVLENSTIDVIFEVMNEITREIGGLITDQYANYVVQHIVEHQHKYEAKLSSDKELRAMEKEKIAKMLAFRMTLYDIVGENALGYSQHKFGSNVVECCLKYGSVVEKDRLIDKVLEGQTLIQMMKDPYANYVVQRVIDKATPKQVSQVVYAVQQNEASLKRLTYGKHIINKLKNALP